MQSHLGNYDHVDATPATPQSPPRHLTKPCNAIGGMGEAEPGKLVLSVHRLRLHAARH